MWLRIFRRPLRCCFIAGILFVGLVPLRAQIDGFKSYRLLIFCGNSSVASADFWYTVPDDGNVGRPLMGLHTACAGTCGRSHVPLADALSKLPASASRALQAKVDAHQLAAASGTGERLNGDGTNESTKTFETCGVNSSWPTPFSSNCKEWAQGTDALSYGTYPALQHEGRDWLNSLHCPALKCEQQFKTCIGAAENELQKCLTRNKLVPIKRNCFADDAQARKRCETARTACLRSADNLPGPQPQPVPTPN